MHPEKRCDRNSLGLCHIWGENDIGVSDEEER